MMKEQEANLFFTGADLEEKENDFEQKIFELKSLLVRSVPVRKLFEAKFKQLEKIQVAASVLFEIEAKSTIIPSLEASYGTSNVQELVLEFQAENNRLRQLLMVASSVEAILSCGNALLDNMEAYALAWKEFEPIGDVSGVKMTEVPDESALVEELKGYGKSISVREVDLLSAESLVRKEGNRLSLWRKFEGNVRRYI